MSGEVQRAIASKGGKAAHERGAAHEWSSEEAAEAGRKGGRARFEARRLQEAERSESQARPATAEVPEDRLGRADNE